VVRENAVIAAPPEKAPKRRKRVLSRIASPRRASTALASPRYAGEPPLTDTRSRIIHAAESLFADRGFDAVSMRDITSAANVNLALVNYHFGSKQALLTEVVTKHAVEIVRQRLELLSRVPLDRDGRPRLEGVVEAFLRPAFELARHPSGAAYLRIRARLALERVGRAKAKFDKAYEAAHQKFIEALGQAMPALPRTQIYWGFHCLMGVTVYTMANSGRIRQLSGGDCDTSDVEEMLVHIIPFIVRGFRDLNVAT
jgi:AcrR family transcriptional regulator